LERQEECADAPVGVAWLPRPTALSGRTDDQEWRRSIGVAWLERATVLEPDQDEVTVEASGEVAVIFFAGNRSIPIESLSMLAGCEAIVSLRVDESGGRARLVPVGRSHTLPLRDQAQSCAYDELVGQVLDVPGVGRRVVCVNSWVAGRNTVVELHDATAWRASANLNRMLLVDHYDDLREAAGDVVRAAALAGLTVDSNAAVFATTGHTAAAIDILRATPIRRVVTADLEELDVEVWLPEVPPSPRTLARAQLALDLGLGDPWADWSRLVGLPLPMRDDGTFDVQAWESRAGHGPRAWLEAHAAELVIAVLDAPPEEQRRLEELGASLVRITDPSKASDIFGVAAPELAAQGSP
jgi:hypothetical protein